MSSRYQHTADRALRILEQREWIQEDMRGKLRSTAIPVKHLDDPRERYTAYFWESVYTAITHNESLIALRAALQAAGYITRLQALGVPTAMESDAYLDARNRVEDLMTDGVLAIRLRDSLVMECRQRGLDDLADHYAGEAR